MDNAGSHTSNYMIHKLVKNNIRVFFNVANSPALNVVELVFADLKYHLRSSNKNTMHELLAETLIFLKKVNISYMFNKIAQSLKYFIMSVNEEEF